MRHPICPIYPPACMFAGMRWYAKVPGLVLEEPPGELPQPRRPGLGRVQDHLDLHEGTVIPAPVIPVPTGTTASRPRALLLVLVPHTPEVVGPEPARLQGHRPRVAVSSQVTRQPWFSSRSFSVISAIGPDAASSPSRRCRPPS
jgi:hypothetical protein